MCCLIISLSFANLQELSQGRCSRLRWGAKDLLNSGNQMLGVRWFGYEVSRPRFKSRKPRKLPSHTRKEQNGYGRCGGVLPQNFADTKAINFRKHQVQQDQVGHE